MHLTRRQFVRLLAATTALACRPDDDREAATKRSPSPSTSSTSTLGSTGAPSDTGTQSTPPIDAFREVLTEALAVLRATPGHRVQRAADLVASGDIDGLFALVRDQVVLQPGLTHLLADHPAEGDDPHANGWGMLYGPRLALRAGAGLARDKVELLAHLLREAGEDAEVVWVQSSISPEQAEACRSIRPSPDSVSLPYDLVERWSAIAGIDLATVQAPDAVAEADVEALTAELLAVLPPLSAPTYHDDIDGERIPMVRWRSGAGASILCPLHPDATLTDPVLSVGSAEAADPTEPPTVELVLTALRSGEDGPLELVRHTFSAADLGGRQTILGFHPVASIDELLGAEIGQRFTSFQPYLAIQALDADVPPEPVFGTVLTTGGSAVTVDALGAVRLDDAPPIDAAETGDVAAVVTVDVEADATAFPRVVVRAWPRDADGVLVPGLGRQSLQVLDEGILQPTLLREVRGDLRVLLLWDESTSMPPAYIDAGRTGRLDEIVDALHQARPDARVTSTTFLVNQAEQLASACSDPGRYDVIFMVTDGETLEDVEAMAPLFAGGPPVMLADVLGTTPAFHRAAAEASGGEVAAVAPETIEDVLVAWIQAQPEGSYVLDYVAETAPDGVRSVTLEVGAVQGDTTYEVPDVSSGSPSRLTGLQLEVHSMGRTQRRLLAGLPQTLGARYHTPDLRRGAFAEVLALLDGGTMLVAEAGTPGGLLAMDDLLVSALDALAWAEDASDLDLLRTRFEAGFPMVPLGAMSLADGERAPVDGGNHAHGLRFVLHHHRHDDETSQSYHQFDLLRVHREHRSGAPEAFLETLRASVRRALLEAATAPDDHTLSRLEGVRLLPVAPGERPPFTFDVALDAYWEDVVDAAPSGWLLVPEDLAIRAAWWVDPESGAAVPLIEHGAGGGVSYQTTIYLVRSYIALAGKLAACGPGLGAVSALMAVVAQYWAIATACVASLEAPDTQRLNDLLKIALCNVFAAAAGAKNLAGPLNLLFTGLGVGFCQVVDKALSAGAPPSPRR